MNILLATSEAVPFAKTGGLADVCGALPIALEELGHSVKVILPAFGQVRQSGQQIESTGIHLDIPIGQKIVRGRLLRSKLPESDVEVILVEQNDYFDRPELYRLDGADYRDNCERFVFFCRAVMESIRLLDLQVDVIHANDWQTGMLPALQKIEYAAAPGYEHIATVMTIHNMAYQGQFWHWDMLLTGLDWKYFNWHEMEFYGGLNLLKTGIVFADAITTVSPTYANEIQHTEFGCGMEEVLRHRSEILSGIMNGVDYRVWNPAHDQHLVTNYNLDTWPEGKSTCKAALQSEMGLPVQPNIPLIGLVGRLVDQKGFDLVARIIEHWAVASNAQWAILGTGEPDYHRLLQQLAQAHPDKLAVKLEFSDPLARRIEAGADIFLMPSRYEPCGLNQLYSLKYGAVPVVHATGGLADSIVDANDENLSNGTANGFSFSRYDAASLEDALGRACFIYGAQRDAWAQLVATGMAQDWSWSQSARKYTELYKATSTRVREAAVCA